MDRLSRPRATVCKFPAHRNYAVTQVSTTGFEPGPSGYESSALTTRPPRHINMYRLLKFTGVGEAAYDTRGTSKANIPSSGKFYEQMNFALDTFLASVNSIARKNS